MKNVVGRKALNTQNLSEEGLSVEASEVSATQDLVPNSDGVPVGWVILTGIRGRREE